MSNLDESTRWNELYQYFQALTLEHYERHPTYTIPSNDVLFDNKPSDCQDRSYALAEYMRILDFNPKFLWLLYWKGKLDAHVCVLLEGNVWDATWTKNNRPEYYNYPMDEYLVDAKPDLHLVTPYWVRYIVR